MNDAHDRRRAAAVAGHTGDADTARALLQDVDGAVRATALAALDRLGDLDDGTLATALGDHDPTVRRRVTEAPSATPDRRSRPVRRASLRPWTTCRSLSRSHG